LQPGDRVAFCLANSPRILELVYGCFAAGLIVVPINARLHAKEVAYIVSNSGAKVLVHGPEYLVPFDEHIDAFPLLQIRACTARLPGTEYYNDLLSSEHRLSAAAEVAATDPCWLFYTSGTTGRPKGAIWTHRMVRVVVMNYLADVYNIQPTQVVLHV